MRFLHTMIRIKEIEPSLHFFCNLLGLKEVRRKEYEAGGFTLIFLSTGTDGDSAEIELTYNWDTQDYDEGRNFGHLAFEVENIYETCRHLAEAGVIINRPPRDGYMAFIRSPDNISIELLQKGSSLEKAEPWASMKNVGKW